MNFCCSGLPGCAICLLPSSGSCPSTWCRPGARHLCGCQAPTCSGEPLATSLLGDTSLIGGGLPRQAWATKPGPLLRHVAVPTTGTTFLSESTGRWNWSASSKLAGLWDPPECCTNPGARPQPRPSELEPMGLESGVCVPGDSSGTCDQVNLGMPQEE